MKIDSIVIANLFLLLLYTITLLIYNQVKKAYNGDKVGYVINIITVAVAFLFLSDYVGFFIKDLEYETIFSVKAVFQLTALTILAFGGIRFISKEMRFSSGKKSASQCEKTESEYPFEKKKYIYSLN